uniref:N-acetylneuraminic acid synthase N-terminal domain-containing protein n=1 Tax=Lutzomyia longipalpis TaxID=7200 RepID=A0A1B0GKY7_LUTLO
MAESSVFFEISNRIIGKGHPCFIIAEIGQNHQGDVERAKKMILQAKGLNKSFEDMFAMIEGKLDKLTLND